MDPKPKPLPRSPLIEGISIIRLLLRKGHPLGVTQVAEALDAPKSSTHRLLQTLSRLGFVEKHATTNRYALNPAIFEFVHDLATNFGRNLSLEKHLRVTAQKLNCSVYLSMLGGGDTYVICGAGDEGNTTRLGTHGPAYATASGKVLVALMDEGNWPQYAPGASSPAITSATNLDPERFYAQLREARRLCFAWNRRESSRDHVSVAAPVREPFVNQPRLAVALLLQHQELAMLDFGDLERAVLALAATLEKELGMR